MRECLRLLAEALRDCDELAVAAKVEDVASGSDFGLHEFLTSNDLWGGSGSIADQAGIGAGSPREDRRKIEDALVQLGREQIRAGTVNARTEMWVSAFEEWKKTGI